MLVSANKSLLRSMLFLGLFMFLLLGLSSVAKAQSVEIASVPGTIVDFDTTRILYSNNANSSLHLRDIITGQDTVISATYAQKGYLTGSGVVYVANSSLYSWKNGVIQTVLNENVGQFIQKNGTYITFVTRQYNDPIQIWVLDTNSNSLKNVSSENGYNSKYENAYVSKDGNVAYVNEQGVVVVYFTNGQTKVTQVNASEYQNFNFGSIFYGNKLFFSDERHYSNSFDVILYKYDFQKNELKIQSGITYQNFDYEEHKLSNNCYVYSRGYRVEIFCPLEYGINYSFSDHSWSKAHIEGFSEDGEVIIKVGDKRYYGKGLNLRLIDLSPYTAQMIKLDDENWYYVLDSGKLFKFLLTDSGGKIKFDFKSALIWADESADTVTVNVYRTGGDYGQISVNYTTVADTAYPGSDYITNSGTLTFAGDEVKKTITVKLVNDTKKELFKSFSIRLTGPQEFLASEETNKVFIAIRDDD
ncbi:Calx-beta domain-containing protein [Paenibacillus sp. SI92]